MKFSIVLFIFISIMSLFMISCDDTNTSPVSECSLKNLNGNCSDLNKVCANGICVLRDSICAPACNDEQVCDNGTCVPKEKNICEPVCSDEEICTNGVCILKKSVCAPACNDEQVCDNGTCIPKENNICEPACSNQEVCDNGSCVLKEDDICEPECSIGQTCVKETCFDLIKEVDCNENTPLNASLANNPKEKVIIGWNSETEKWGEAEDCEWICNAGYKYNEDSDNCVDVDECATDNAGCSQNCRNTDGSFECSCETGYTLNSDNLSCDNVNDVKVITFNLALGAKRCYSTNPSTGDTCPVNCALDCNSSQKSCVKQLFKTDDSIQKIATYLHNQFEENEHGIIFLQEVNTNINGVNALQVIVDELGGSWDYTFYSPMENTYGIAILSNIIHTKQQFWELPVPSGQEERGAIALKMKLNNKFIWIVNAHLGLTNSDRVVQIEEIKNKYLTFTSTANVLIAGDFNILDIYAHGENVSISSEQIIHYGNTIQKLLETGLKKIEFKSSENRKYSFHSWNSARNGRNIDYILWLDREGDTPPEMTTLRPGPYSTTQENAYCSEYNSDTRYLSDHNGLMFKYNIFK